MSDQPSNIETIGSYLKREREFRQISVEEIAESTRINHVFIEAIEHDRFDELPAVAFVRGYLKAYSDHVGLDTADVLLRYEQWLVQEDGAGETPATETQPKQKWRWKWQYLWVTLVLAGIVALAGLLASQ